jgi:hypothetical protein
MVWSKRFLLAFLLLSCLISTPVVHACPSCSAAIQETSGAEDEDREREGQAYNNSIYLMVGMPYLLLGTVSFLIYRGRRRHVDAGVHTPAY